MKATIKLNSVELKESRIIKEWDNRNQKQNELKFDYTVKLENGKVTEVLNSNNWPCRKESEVFEYFSNKYN